MRLYKLYKIFYRQKIWQSIKLKLPTPYDVFNIEKTIL